MTPNCDLTAVKERLHKPGKHLGKLHTVCELLTGQSFAERLAIMIQRHVQLDTRKLCRRSLAI